MDAVPKTSGLRRYEPAVAVRFGWWFGIYLLSWVFLVWCWHGELSNWFSPLLVPAGLIDLSYAITGYLSFSFNCDGKALFYLASSIYAAHLALSLIVRSRNAFWILMAILLLILALGSFGTMQFGGIVADMSNNSIR